MRTAIAALIAVALLGCSHRPGFRETRPAIVLVTDYGTRDFYVGALKGAIRSENAEADVIDATHEVKAFDIAEGAYTLLRLAPLWPPGTIFVVIVDPGVGTARRGIAVRTLAGRVYVGPDNGLLTYVLDREGLGEARELSNKALWRAGATSSTFHGRDVFGPVAAHLAAGVPISDVGPATRDLVRLPVEAARVADGRILAAVVHVDAYGNASTNATVDMLRAIGANEGDALEATVGGRPLRLPWGATYGSVPEGSAVLVIDSDGGVELAINMGSLAQAQGLSAGAQVSIRKP